MIIGLSVWLNVCQHGDGYTDISYQGDTDSGTEKANAHTLVTSYLKRLQK